MKTAQYVRQEKAIAAAKHDDLACRLYPELHSECQRRIADEARRIEAEIAQGFVYVVEFTSGVVKVGKTANPVQRIANHAHFARIHGGNVRRSWTSEEHYCCGSTERELIEYCAQVGELVAGREYFRADFHDVRTRASILVVNGRITVADAHARLGDGTEIGEVTA
jgi:hypothetical protein